MAESLGNKAAKGAVWATVDKVGSLALQFGVNLVLARLLMPSDYGVIGMLTIFIAVSQVLIDAGFGSALIQKRANTTRFFYNLYLECLVLFIAIFSIISNCTICRRIFFNACIMQCFEIDWNYTYH